MTVTNQTNRTSATGTNTIGQAIAYSFPANLSSDLVVKTRITTTGVEATLTLTTDYTATVSDTGGTVTMVSAIPVTKEIHIIRKTPSTQSLDLVAGGSFDPESIEDALDKVTKLAIENKDALTRTPKFPATDPTSSIGNVPNSIDRAGKNAGYDSDGKPNASVAVAEGSVSFTTTGTNIAEAADAPAVRKLIGTVYDVVTYGADDDGVVDATSAIQAAVDAAVGGVNGVIVFPHGTYKISSTITIDNTNQTVIGLGQVIFNWDGGNDDVMFDLVDWNQGEFGNFIFSNANNATGMTAVLLTSNAVTVTANNFHDLVFGQPALGFEKGLQIGTGATSYYTSNTFDRMRFRHCNYGVHQNSTTFDLNVFRNTKANGGGGGTYGSGANATNHFYFTNGGHVIIDEFESNRCTGYSIRHGASSISLKNGWFENSGGALHIIGGGSEDLVLIENCKFDEGVQDASGYSLNLNPASGSVIAIRGCEFDTGNAYVFGIQTLFEANNSYSNGALIKRNTANHIDRYMMAPNGWASPVWVKIVFDYTEFEAAATSDTVDLTPMLGAVIVHRCVVRPLTAFAGGSVSAAVAKMGITGDDDDGFFADINVYVEAWRVKDQSDQGVYLWDNVNNVPIDKFLTASTAFTLILTLTGDNCDNLTQGSLDVWLLVSDIYSVGVRTRV